MSPPHLLPDDNYNKPLADQVAYFDYSNPCISVHFYNQREGTILRFQEINGLPGSEYSGCIEVYACHFNEMALDSINAIVEDIPDPYDAGNEVMKAFVVPDDEERIGRFAFKDFEIEGCVGKQIKGAFVEGDYQQAGISSAVYKLLIKKYGFLVSDNSQTRMGHMLWTLSVLKWGIVKIFDCEKKAYVGELNYKEVSHPVKPWSIPYNFPLENNKYLRPDMCEITNEERHNLVLVTNGSLIDK